MMRPINLVAALMASVFVASAGLAATDPVKEGLRKLKARINSAKVKAAPKPAPKPVKPPTATVRRGPRYSRGGASRPSGAAPRPFVPNMPKLDFEFKYQKDNRLGSIPKTGDILVETTNRGQIVYAYWRVELISGPDGLGRKKDVAPGKYLVMLKGPTLPRPWVVYATVRPDTVTVLKVELPENS